MNESETGKYNDVTFRNRVAFDNIRCCLLIKNAIGKKEKDMTLKGNYRSYDIWINQW